MSQVDINKKYNNFLAPKNQITVNNEDILEKYGIQASEIIVEEAIEDLPKFNFAINDLLLLQIRNGLFELNKKVAIKIGYANKLETVVEGEITSTKSIFPSDGPPRIEVYGRARNIVNAIPVANNNPIFTLTYGRTLLSFISIASIQEQNSKLATNARASSLKVTKRSLRCSAECVGLPDIKAQILISVEGIGNTYNGNYYVEKVTHTLKNGGYTTSFEAERP